MRAERRHELKENDLSHMLGEVRAYLSRHGIRAGAVVVALVALVVLVAVVNIAVQARSSEVESAWRKKTALTFTDIKSGKESLAVLSAMTKASKDESFVLASLMDQGLHALRLAQEADMPPDPEMNDQARSAYRQLLTRFPKNPLALGAAHSGLATVAENDYILDHDGAHEAEARKHLLAITDDATLATTPYRRLASDRLKKLDSLFSDVRFVAAPPPPPPPTPLDQTPGSVAVPPGVVSTTDESGRTFVKVKANEKGELVPVEEGEEKQKQEPIEGRGEFWEKAEESSDPTDQP